MPPARVTIRTRSQTLDRLRNTVHGVRAAGFGRVSLESLIELGMVLAAQRLEAAHHDGEPFPIVGPLPPGRRPRR